MSDWIRGSLVIVLALVLGCSGGGGADDLMRRARRSASQPAAEVAAKTTEPEALSTSEETGPEGDSEANTGASPLASDARVREPASPETTSESRKPEVNLAPERLATDASPDSREDYLQRMQEIGKAFSAEIAKNQRMPALAIKDDDSNELLSWRVRILPSLGYEDLYRQFRLNEPWNSEHNLALLPLMPKVYRSGASDVGKTCFQLPRGEYTLFGRRGESAGLLDISDGVGSTVIMLWVSPSRSVPWTAPEDFMVSEANDARDLAVSDRDTHLVLWADGRAAEIRTDGRNGEYRKMMTYRGREAFSPRDIEFGVETEIAGVGSSTVEGAPSAAPGLAGPMTPAISFSLDLPNRVSGASLDRMTTGEWEHAAELALLSELLRDESSTDLRGEYLPATGGLVPFVRIGLGATVPLGPRTPDANPIRNERSTAPGLRRAPRELETLTGDVGEAVVGDLWKEAMAGRLGSRQLPLGEMGTSSASPPSQDERFISIGIEYLGNDRLSALLDGARYRGLDLLIHFDVELTVTRQNIIANTTVVRVHDVRTGKKLFESPPINNIREMRSEASVADESVLAKARVKFQEFLTESVSLKSDHEPTPDEVRARVTQLTEKIERPDWVGALEVREYFRRGLVSRVEFEQAYYGLLKVDSQSFAVADPEARFEALLAGQDASLVLIAREAKSWEPKPVAAGGEIEE